MNARRRKLLFKASRLICRTGRLVRKAIKRELAHGSRQVAVVLAEATKNLRKAHDLISVAGAR